MIRFSQVSKRYAGEVEALVDVSVGIAPGELAFLWGPSGAGKSTFLRLIAAAERPSEGRVEVEGEDLSRLRGKALPLLRRRMGLIFQDLRLLEARSALENVALPLVVRGEPLQRARERSLLLLERLGLAEKAREPAGSLSGGERQRVGIARALVVEPAILLADEPTGHLDPQRAAQVMGLFAEVHQKGCTVLIATHDPTLIESAGGRVLHLERGRVSAS